MVVILLLAVSSLMPRVALSDFYISPSGNDSNPGTLAAPFQTIDQARLAVQGVRSGMSSDLTVYLRGGTYPLSSTLAFGANDSGANGHNVVYQAYGNETPVLSGGTVISGWSSVGGGVYRASVGGGFRFRQLYINGVRGVRARTPNVGRYYYLIDWMGSTYAGLGSWDPNAHYIDVNTSETASWDNLSKVEMVVSMEWQFARTRIGSLTASGATTHVKFLDPDARKAFYWNLNLYESGAAYFFENAHEFLDQPGEWYNDESAGYVYYMPRAGEDLSSALVMVPAVERLVQFSGAQNIRFQGLTFEGSTWLLPSDEGYNNGQGDYYREPDDPTRYSIAAAIYLEYSSNITFERNVIRNTGGAAFTLWKGSRSILIEGNVLRELAAGGIHAAIGVDPTIANDALQNITISNNYIVGYGRDYPGGQGVQTHFVKSMYVNHNEVTDGGYTGIGMDWRGNDGSSSVDVQITHNLVYNVMNLMADGGGIYTFQVNLPSTSIQYNYVHDLHRSAFAGVYGQFAAYLDEGADYVTLLNNVLANADGSPSYPNELINTNNWISQPGASLHNNYGGYNPTADATIQANAGLEAAYQDIKSGGGNGSPPPITSAPAPTTTVPSGSLPDVIVTALSYANGQFTATVKNQGNAATPSGVPIGVGYFVDGQYQIWGIVSDPLAAGASVTIGTKGGRFSIPDGTHTIMAYVDDVNRFAESDETNN